MRENKSQFFKKSLIYIAGCVCFVLPDISFSAECPDGFGTYPQPIQEDTFIAPVANKCAPGYEMRTVDETFLTPLFTGALTGNVVTVCSGGHYVNGSCVDFTQGDCPGNYNDANVSDTTFTTKTDGSCEDGYNKYDIGQICSDISTAPMCMIASCDGTMTDFGECATACTFGVTELKIKKPDNTILTFPLWSAKTTQPAIHVKLNDEAICYVGLATGPASDSINLTYGDMTYHVTD